MVDSHTPKMAFYEIYLLMNEGENQVHSVHVFYLTVGDTQAVTPSIDDNT